MTVLLSVGLAIAAPVPVAPAQGVDLGPAIAARESGDFDRAIELLEAADRASPANPEILRLLGTSYAFARRYEPAIAALNRARALAPRDQDIALALARAYLWSGRIGPAAEIAAAIARDDPGNAELPVLSQAINRARNGEPGFSPRPLIALSQSIAHVRVGETRREWADTIVTLAVPLSPRTTISTDLERENRAGIVDVRGLVRLDRRFARGAAYVAVSATPDADFRERWGLRAGGEVAVAPMLMLTGDIRFTDFGRGQTVSAEPGVRLVSPSDRWSIAVRSINLWDERGDRRAGWAVRGEHQVGTRLRLIAGGATYPDTEAGITRRLRSAFGGAVLSVTDDVVVRATFEHEDRRDSYVRDTAAVGVSVRF
jgi:YaiO family outer membrane protein